MSLSNRLLHLTTNSPSTSRYFRNNSRTYYASHLKSNIEKCDCRQMSQLATNNAKRAFLVDTLKLVRELERQGVPAKQAEAITTSIIEVLNESLNNAANSSVSQSEMQKSVMVQESKLSMFQSEVQSLQEHHFSMWQRETEKLQGNIEKMRNELRHEIDKVTAGLRLDLNLGKGRIRDELSNQNAETTDLTNKLDKEIHTLRVHMETAKYDIIKYSIGTLVSMAAVGLATLRILL